MANRMTTPVNFFCLEKKVTAIFAQVTFGAAGAPTLSAVNSKGVLSVTRSSAGRYVFVFGVTQGAGPALDTYVKLLNVSHVQVNATAPAAPSIFVANNSSNVAGTASITVQYNLSGTATDPASGEIGYFQFTFGDSTAP